VDLTVGAFFAMHGMCSLYNWLANIFGNIRARPQPSPPAADVIPPHLSKLTLPTFWISEPAAWFALAEAKFGTSNTTNQRVMFDLLVAALPEKNLSQVMDIIKNIPAINPFKVLKLRLLEAHMLSDQEKMGRSFPAGAPRQQQAVPAPGLYAVSVPFRNGDPAGFPVSFPAEPSPPPDA
jgi:hypothetical protein